MFMEKIRKTVIVMKYFKQSAIPNETRLKGL